jgi:hypothetical protein
VRKAEKMDAQKLQELTILIEEGLVALRQTTTALKMRKAMLPTLAAHIDANEITFNKAIQALFQLKRALGIPIENGE